MVYRTTGGQALHGEPLGDSAEGVVEKDWQFTMHWCNPAVFAGARGCYCDVSSQIIQNVREEEQLQLQGNSTRPVFAIQKGTRVLISLWDSLMFGRVLKSTTIF